MRWKIVVLAAVLSSTGAARAAEEEKDLPRPYSWRRRRKRPSGAWPKPTPPSGARALCDLCRTNFSGDTEVLEDALAKDFRNYRSVNLDLIPDRVQVQAPLTSIEFHYNLNVITDQGVNSNFSGRSNYVFRWKRERASSTRWTGRSFSEIHCRRLKTPWPPARTRRPRPRAPSQGPWKGPQRRAAPRASRKVQRDLSSIRSPTPP